jgi:hypothetical protein
MHDAPFLFIQPPTTAQLSPNSGGRGEHTFSIRTHTPIWRVEGRCSILSKLFLSESVHQYPFPRTPRPHGNPAASPKTAIEIPPSPTTPRESIIPSGPPSSPIIDTEVFKQLLAMEDENSPFSFTHGLIDLYYEDGGKTLQQMRNTL